ncbi:MAG: glycosyltransferase family 39 protein [Chloroflexota bacterium]|nr:glycosyltransferase family 39 protein [Chloroflexota bacterium]
MTQFFSCSKNRRILFWGILLLALVLRLAAIGARPLWYDEAFAILFAQEGLADMLTGTLTPANGSAADVHPLAYYTCLHAWMMFFGQSPWAVRSFSVLLGMGVLLIVYVWVRDFYDPRLAALALLLVAISPFQIHYAQEVRMYAMMTFFLMGATYSLWKGMMSQLWSWWLLFATFSALAQYTHNLAGFYLLPLALIPLLKREWRSLRAVIVSGLAAVILYAPWLLRLPAQFDKVRTSYWVATPSPARLLTTLLSFVTNLPLPDAWLPAALFATLFLVVLGFWQTFRAWQSSRKGVGFSLWLVYLAFVPPLFLYFFSLWQPVYIERALLPSGVIFLLWLAWVLSRSGLPRWMSGFAAAILLIGMGMGIYQHITYRGFPYGSYQALDSHLAQEISPGDRIVHSNKLTMLPAVYYDRDLPQSYIADSPGSGSDTLALPTQQILGLIAEPDIEAAVGEASRVWLLIFIQAIEEYQVQGYDHPHIAWLEENFVFERVDAWDDIQLYVYVRE